MKSILLVLVAVLLTTATSLPLRAAEKAADKPAAAPKPGEVPNMEEMMKRWEEIRTPGAPHKLLDMFAGEWEVESTVWMGGQGSGEPTKSKGTSKTRWILGHRYQQQEFSGEMMGQPFQGTGLTGYDNFRKRYFSTWVDDLGTGLFTCEGTADPAGKVFTYTGKMDEPATGEKDKPVKVIVRVVNPDKYVFEMHDLVLGDKSKVMEMTYTRKK